MKIELTVLGSPQALKRHRTFKRGNFIGQYDPSKVDKADFLALAHQSAPDMPIKGPVGLTVAFFMPRPRNHYRTGKNAGELKQDAPVAHTKNPDLSNMIKFIEDSLNRVFWQDDKLIYKIFATKVYSEKPRTEIIIEELS